MFDLVLVILLVFVASPYLIYLIGYELIAPYGCPADKEFTIDNVSVILPTHNEESLVEAKLSELAKVAYPTECLEVVVVDSSTDGTAEVARSFVSDSGPLDVQVIEEDERRGVATAVNTGVESATGKIIFRTDCDSHIGDETISHAVAALQDPTVGGVMGRQTTVLGGSKVETKYRDLQARNQAFESELDSTFIVHGPCFAFRRDDFEPISADSLADDTEVGVSIRRKNKRVILDPAMEFAESSVSGIRGRRKRKDRRAMGLIQSLFRSRDMVGGYGLYGRFILPFNWWFLVVAPWLTFGVLASSLIAGFVWFEIGGVAIPLALIVFILLGQRDLLGPAQSVYAVFDSNVSLVLASVRLLTENNEGVWEIDTESRDQFKK